MGRAMMVIAGILAFGTLGGLETDHIGFSEAVELCCLWLAIGALGFLINKKGVGHGSNEVNRSKSR